VSFRSQSGDGSNNNRMKKQLDHYLQLLWQRLWFVLPVSLLVTVMFFVAISKMGLLIPELEATAVMQFDDPKNLSAVDERIGLQADAKAVLVKSRSFLEREIQKLSLQFQISRCLRSEVIDSVSVASDAQVGSYILSFKGSSYQLSFSNGKSKKKIFLESGDVSSLSKVKVPGVKIYWSRQFAANPFDIKFRVLRLRDAVDDLLTSITIKASGKDNIIMSLSVSGRDYQLITKTANTLADDFVKENDDTKRVRKEELLGTLEKQLESARTEMVQAETAMKRFREANPTVGLTDAFAPPVRIMELQDTEAELKSALLQAKALQVRYGNSNDSNKIMMLNEMIAFLVRYQTGTSEAFQAELDQLVDQSKTLREQYSPKHPLVTQNKSRLKVLGMRVNSALADLIVELNRKAKENSEKINKFNNEIAGLPSKELQFANLQKKYEVNAQIFATVLTRYNEAKIAIATAVGDVYVVDHAVEPEQIADFKTLVVFIGLGIMLGVAAGVGPIVTIDFFDRTARTEKDLRRMSELLILESVPVKGYWKKFHESPTTEGFNEKLVSANYTHNFVDETYRSLRAKILLSLHEEKCKKIVITSLNMGEGKSFTAANLAITMAQQRISTLLIDGDLKRGTQHQYFGRNKKPGLSNILLDAASINSASIEPLLQTTHIPELILLSSGGFIPNSAELLNSLRFRSILEFLSKTFDMIILDTPPMAVATDAVGVQDSFNKYIVVVRAAHTNIFELNKKVKEFPGLKKKVLGLVFNGAPYKRNEYYQYNSYKY
jgi:capsular exopolysaccharide synthesis family protein